MDPIGTDTEAIPGVENLVHTLVKGLRAVQLYLPNNPVYEQAMLGISEAFAAVWQETSELILEIGDTTIICEDEQVYDQPTKSESISWLLFKDGIRTVTFRPGVEEQEIGQFLVLLNQVRSLPPDADDDLLTLLWEAEFTQLSYQAVQLTEDDGAPIEAQEREPQTASDVRHHVQQAIEEQAPEEFVSMEDSDKALFDLQPDEIAYLKRELAREYDQDLRASVLAILFDVFETQEDQAVREEVVSILHKFVPHLLAAGDFGSVIYVLRESKVVRDRGKGLTDEQRDSLDTIPAMLSEPETFGRLVQALEQSSVESHEDELERLFGGLQPKVFSTALEWLPKMENKKTSALLEDGLIKIAIAHPYCLVDALRSDIAEVILMAVRFAKTLAISEIVPDLGKVLEHSNPEIRSEVVAALEAIGSQESLAELQVALEDGSRDVRIAVVRLFGSRSYKPALPLITAKLSDKEFRTADLTEKKVFFETFAALSGDEGVEHLAPMLLAKSFMKHKEDPEVRACAAMALGRIGSEDAAKVLREAGSDKDPLVRNAIKKALKETESQ